MLVVLGDALLDRDLSGRIERLSPDAPVPIVEDPTQRTRPGGAGLAAALASSDGRDVVLITALADDAAGRELARLLDDAGVEVIDLGLEGQTPEKVRIRSDGRTLLRMDRGGAPGTVRSANGRATRTLGSATAVLVADYGRGVVRDARLRQALGSLASRVPIVWDPHPRGSEPTPSVRLVTPNAVEAARFAPEVAGDGLTAVAERGRILAQRWSAGGVAITLGHKGAVLVSGDGPPMVVPAPTVLNADPCGAGDRFASAAAGMLADGALPSEAVAMAVLTASVFVAEGGAAAFHLGRRPDLSRPQAESKTSQAQAIIARTRARGGTVVATGGCFDLLHAGHVRFLRQARALGDCLIICLNDDASVRRLKGPGRPLVAEEDRAAVLSALDCVDAVVVFDEDTPEAILARLRPDIFAKGGDYAVADLPEAELIKTWGGQTVLLPYLEGRSTSLLVSEAARRFAR
jgi:rfaE bifunctional protein nucleotidyltransferase chain/domain/rfaE bifunctional protein kinase chain/domain